MSRLRSSAKSSLFVAALGVLAAVSVPVWMGGCGRDIVAVKEPKKCDLQVVSLSIITAPVINPTNSGDARPVMVRIYQLKNDVRLQNATFEQIWKNDKETLVDDIVKVDELPVYPNSRTEVKFERDESAQNVVGVALFRNPKGKSWFTSFELPPSPKAGEGCNAGCKGEECDGGGPILNPKFSLWIEGTRVDMGDEHLEDIPPDGGRIQVVHLTGGGKAPDPKGGAIGGPTGPEPPPSKPAAGGKK